MPNEVGVVVCPWRGRSDDVDAGGRGSTSEIFVLYGFVAGSALCLCSCQGFMHLWLPVLCVGVGAAAVCVAVRALSPPRLPVIYVPVAVGALCPCGCQGYPSACQRFVPG